MTENTDSKPVNASVLVVDDEPGVRLLLKAALSRVGYQVHCVEDGQQGIAMLNSRSFDVLLTDKNMPGMDGVQLAQRARSLYPGICTVLITGYASNESANEATSFVDSYLTKPFSVHELQAQVGILLKRRRARNKIPTAGHIPRAPPALALLIEAEEQRKGVESVARSAGLWLREAVDASRIGDLPSGTVLIVDCASCTADVYRAIWQRQSKDRDFGVILASSPTDTHAPINAASLGARFRLTLPASRDDLLAVVSGAWSAG